MNYSFSNTKSNFNCLLPQMNWGKGEGVGDKNYELKNHLGNVLAVVTDRKIVKPYVSGAFDGFESDVVSYSNYYPFGMEIKALSLQGDYRFGFGGHEKDDEVSGNGNHLAFGDYGYNPRLGRRFNIDPMIGTFPWMSPYATFNNNPIYFADPTGLSPDGPGDREINEDINSDDKFKGDKSIAGTTGTSAKGKVVFADVSKGARLGPFANASRIARANGLTTDQLYALNPGLKENKNNIGQGQLIYVSGPNAPIMTPKESKDGVSIADKSPSSPNNRSWISNTFKAIEKALTPDVSYVPSSTTKDKTTSDGADDNNQLVNIGGNVGPVYGDDNGNGYTGGNSTSNSRKSQPYDFTGTYIKVIGKTEVKGQVIYKMLIKTDSQTIERLYILDKEGDTVGGNSFNRTFKSINKGDDSIKHISNYKKRGWVKQ